MSVAKVTEISSSSTKGFEDAVESGIERANETLDKIQGVWGNSTARRDILESGDVEDGLNAAASIGDDRIQKKSGRHVNPDGFTHGTSKQRVEWFARGSRPETSTPATRSVRPDSSERPSARFRVGSE